MQQAHATCMNEIVAAMSARNETQRHQINYEH